MKEYPTELCKGKDCAKCELEQLCGRFLDHFEAMVDVARKTLERLEQACTVFDNTISGFDGVSDSIIDMYEELMDRHSEVMEQNARLTEALEYERKRNEKLYQLVADSIKERTQGYEKT